MQTAQAPAIKRWEVLYLNPAVQQRLIALTYVLLTMVAVYPVLSVSVPPLIDYPNHLARLHVLTAIGDDPLLAERYAVTWKILPNLAMDGIVYVLTRWFSVLDIMRVFVAVSMVMIVAGTLAIQRALYGYITLVPAAVFLLLYNHILIFGFVNYYFGIGLFLLVFAGWLAAREWTPWARLLLFSVATVALFFAHLFAFGVYGLSVVAYELWQAEKARDWWSKASIRNWAVSLGQFALPIMLYLAGRFGEARNSYTHYGDLSDKLLGLLSPVWCYGETLDRVIFAFLAILLVRGLFTGRLRIIPSFRYVMLVLLIAALLMPNWLIAVWGVDFRLPVVILCLVAASARLELPSFRWGAALLACGLVLFVARIWTISDTWRAYDAQFTEFRQASKVMAPGARLLTLQKAREDRFDKPYWHMAALAIIDRSVFLPTLFTDPTAQPVRASDAYQYIDTPYGTPLTLGRLIWATEDPTLGGEANTRLPMGYHVFWGNWPRDFDYVLFVHFGFKDNPVPKYLKLAHAGSFFDIYQVVRP